jgi:hypothetical protein
MNFKTNIIKNTAVIIFLISQILSVHAQEKAPFTDANDHINRLVDTNMVMGVSSAVMTDGVVVWKKI